MSLSRKINRSIARDDLSLDLLARKGVEMNSESRALCLAGNTSSGVRRRALRAVAHEIKSFQPTLKEVKVVEHYTPDVLDESTGELVSLPNYTQEISVMTRYNRVSILAKTQQHLAEIAGKAVK